MGDSSENDGSDGDDYIGFGFATRTLKALYDYSYSDDFGKMVHMKAGEEYCLLEKSGEWWEVIRASDSATGSDDRSFYVPANYVKLVDDKSDGESKTVNKRSSDSDVFTPGSDSAQLDASENKASADHGVNDSCSKKGNHKPDEEMDASIYSNTSTFMTNNNVDISSNKTVITVRPGVYPVIEDDQDEGDYMNLDTLRDKAGLPTLKEPPPPAEDTAIYANLQELRIQPQISVTSPRTSPPVSPDELPIPDEKNCPFLRTLLGVWDVYLDPLTKRNFYLHRESKERTWKPPRYPKKPHLQTKVDVSEAAPVIPDVRVERASIVIPDGWTLEATEMGTVYVNKCTQEKWGTHSDEGGKPYFYKIDTGRTAWKLPEEYTGSGINRRNALKHYSGTSTQEFQSVSLTPNGDSTGSRKTKPQSRSPQRTAPQVPRSVKTQSMFLESQLSFGSFQGQPAGGPMSKSSTLPVNPTEQGMAPEGWGLPKSHTLPYNLQGAASISLESEKKPLHPGTSNQGQEKICGTLKKRMIVEMGKPIKKNFSTSYVKLLGTNLVFYKNRQAADASSQQGARRGKPDFMEPLQGAHIDKYPSKKHLNVLVLTTCNKNQYHLQLDDEIDMQKWLSTVELTIQELGPCMVDQQLLVLPGNSNSLKKSASFKQKARKPSEDISQDDDKKSNVKTFFERWIKDPQRPTKKQLEDKGIIEYNVFGGDLKQVCEKDKSKVPKFVQRCIAAIEKRGLDQDGLYRISGNMAQITKLRSMLNMDRFDYDLDNPDLWDVHVLCGALKLFFRELKEPLFAQAQFDKFIAAIGKKSRSDKLKHLREQMNNMPKYNYETLKFLCAHLMRVADLQNANKMSFHNLAIVFGPTLMWKELDTNFMLHLTLQSQIVEFVLLEYKNIFK